MADTTLPGLLSTGDHASRPAASAIGSGGLYACSDHALVYQTDGSSWTTWASLGGGGIQETLIDAKGDLVAGSAADTAARLAVGTDGYVLTADSGEATGLAWAAPSGSSSPVPVVVQSVSQYQESSTTNALTVTAPTAAAVVIVQSETRGASSITQTNVTWTQRYTGNAGGVYVEVWTGAISGAAGTTVTVNFASATKSSCTFTELSESAFTSVGTAVTATNGLLSLTGATAGQVCVYAETSFNANTAYVASNLPFAPVQSGGCLNAGFLYFRAKLTNVAVIQSGAATRFAALMRIS